MIVPQAFYARDALEVAPELLGKLLKAGDVVLRITEVEAYRPADSASHCRMGRTKRNEPMWGPPGHAYVYLCYGIHNMLNLVTNQDGEGAAVLIRSCEPVSGHAVLRARRKMAIDDPLALTGPGKVAAALALDTRHSGLPLFRRSELVLLDAEAPASILAGPRVGIDYATPEHRDAPWRFASGDTHWVSHRKRLRPLSR
jgi:DNA-3-methyladenine glycosylase